MGSNNDFLLRLGVDSPICCRFFCGMSSKKTSVESLLAKHLESFTLGLKLRQFFLPSEHSGAEKHQISTLKVATLLLYQDRNWWCLAKLLGYVDSLSTIFCFQPKCQDVFVANMLTAASYRFPDSLPPPFPVGQATEPVAPPRPQVWTKRSLEVLVGQRHISGCPLKLELFI